MENDLVVAVQRLSIVQNRYDTMRSDSTGTSSGDDGVNRDYHRDDEQPVLS